LGIKQAEEDPWLTLPEKYPPGTRIRGKVRNLTSFGAFVEVEPGIDGLVHVSDMSWTKRIQHPSEVLKKSDEVDVVVLSIDVDQKRISLGLKQTEDDPWYSLAQTYAPGTESEGIAVRLLDKGVVVDLGEDVEGFVPVSQIVEGKEIDNPADVLQEGHKLKMKVMESDPINRRIVLQVVEILEAPPEPVAAAEPEGDAEAPPEGDAEAPPEGDAEAALEAEAAAEAPEAEAEAQPEVEVQPAATEEAEAETVVTAEAEAEEAVASAEEAEEAVASAEEAEPAAETEEPVAAESEEPAEEAGEEEKKD
jgi:small subunit ribosomal protein S1